MHRRIAGSMLLIGLLFAIAGCTAPAPQAESEPALDAVPTIHRPEQVQRPIDAFLPTSDQLVALAQVQLAAQNACLAEHGVTGTYQTSGDLADFVRANRESAVTHSSLWGFFSPDTTTALGYRAAGFGILNTSPPAGASEDVLRTCDAVGRDRLGGEVWFSFAFLSSLPSGGPGEPLSDSRWLSAVKDWSACMRERGFDYASPLDAIGRWLGSGQSAATTSPSADEIATATADVACTISTNLVGIGVALQTAYDNRYIQEHRAELDAFVATRDDLLRGDHARS